MLNHRSNGSSRDISRRVDALRQDIALLGESLADAAMDNTRAPRRAAKRYVEDTYGSLSEQASALTSQGLAAARHSGREVSHQAVEAFDQAADAARRHPIPFALAVVGVGLATALLVNMMSRNESPRKRPSRTSY